MLRFSQEIQVGEELPTSETSNGLSSLDMGLTNGTTSSGLLNADPHNIINLH